MIQYTVSFTIVNTVYTLSDCRYRHHIVSQYTENKPKMHLYDGLLDSESRYPP